MVGEYLIEALARIPAEVDVASEYRYREPTDRRHPGVVTEAGETIDTLEALREAKKSAAMTLGVNNHGQYDRPRNGRHLYIHAGPEIGLASTKAYTSHGQRHADAGAVAGARTRARSTTITRARELLHAARELPRLVEEALAPQRVEAHEKRWPRSTPTLRDYLLFWLRLERPHRAGRGPQAQGSQLHPR